MWLHQYEEKLWWLSTPKPTKKTYSMTIVHSIFQHLFHSKYYNESLYNFNITKLYKYLGHIIVFSSMQQNKTMHNIIYLSRNLEFTSWEPYMWCMFQKVHKIHKDKLHTLNTLNMFKTYIDLISFIPLAQGRFRFQKAHIA